MATTKLGMLVQRPPYKSENPKLALTHAIASQTVEIYLEDGDMVEPVVAFVGEGVLNCKNNQAMEHYKITTTENHLMNSLLVDLKVYVCKEDMERFGMTESDLPDAEAMGADEKMRVATWDEIFKELDATNHLLFF